MTTTLIKSEQSIVKSLFRFFFLTRAKAVTGYFAMAEAAALRLRLVELLT
jgi:hypothetical protein